jgi:hypothetical protein
LSGFSSAGVLGVGGSCSARLEAAEDGWSVMLGPGLPGCCAPAALPDMPPTRTTTVQIICQRLKVPPGPWFLTAALEQAHPTSVSVEFDSRERGEDVLDASVTGILVHLAFLVDSGPRQSYYHAADGSRAVQPGRACLAPRASVAFLSDRYSIERGGCP